MGMGSFLTSSKSQVENINKIWRHVYLAQFKISERNIVMQISTKPIKCDIIS